MIKKAIITTFNKRLFDEYAHQMINTYSYTQQDVPLYVFVEDDPNQYPDYDNVTFKSLFKAEPECEKFVKRNEGKPVTDFLNDAVRFNYKVFAQAAAHKLAEKVYYVDSDSVFMKKIPEEWFNQCLPDNVFISFYHRPNQFTETGFVAFNNTIPIAERFFEKYKEWYVNDSVYTIHRLSKGCWTDCHTLDETRLKLKDEDTYTEKHLGDGGNGHIMARDKFINPYIDHRKGPRKKQANSPEWKRNR